VLAGWLAVVVESEVEEVGSEVVVAVDYYRSDS